MSKLKILTFTAGYLPGYKGGGPIRTLANLVDQLGDEFRFKVITLDRDLGDCRPYPTVEAGAWQVTGKADVHYLNPQSLSFGGLRRLIRATAHEAVYLNSFFSFPFTIKPLVLRRLGLVPKVPVIVAPRGEFSPGALATKGLKKRLYIAVAKLFGLYRSVVWQASSLHEEADIRHSFGDRVPVIVAPDLRGTVPVAPGTLIRSTKIPGRLRVLFLSRISRMKNLTGALTMLSELIGEVEFSIVGPLEDKDYWDECQQIMNKLPPHVRVEYRGSITHDKVASVMAQHDVFLLPTLGENFGHVILEALSVGLPVVISDQTPWRSLQDKGVGWDLPLRQPELFRVALQECVDMDEHVHREWSERAVEYGLRCVDSDNAIERNRLLFTQAHG